MSERHFKLMSYAIHPKGFQRFQNLYKQTILLLNDFNVFNKENLDNLVQQKYHEKTIEELNELICPLNEEQNNILDTFVNCYFNITLNLSLFKICSMKPYLTVLDQKFQTKDNIKSYEIMLTQYKALVKTIEKYQENQQLLDNIDELVDDYLKFVIKDLRKNGEILKISEL